MYNACKTIERCVKSICASRAESIEILLVDDASTDNTWEQASKLAQSNPSIRLIQQAHAGASEARNRGIREAQGEWILFLDADDSLLDDAIPILTENADESIDACCGRIVRGTEAVRGKNSTQFLKTNPHDLLNFALSDPTNRLTLHGWLFRRSICVEFGIWFNPSFRLSEDSDWVLRFLSACRGAKFIGNPVYRYTISPESTIHRWKPGQMQAYLDMLAEINQSSVSSESNWPLFVLTTLLLILTHDTFHPAKPTKLRAQLSEAKMLRSLPVFEDAFRLADLSKLGPGRRMILSCLKARLYLLVWMAVKLRQTHNMKRQEKTE